MITATRRRRGMIRRRGRGLRAGSVVLIAVALAVLPVLPVRAQASPTLRLFAIQDPRIGEASGIAAGIISPGILYVQNDSGDTNRFFALNRATGATAAVVSVPGASNVDWEDIAVARDPAGTPSVWLADIGDNAASRSEVDVYRVDEPHVKTNDRDRPIRSALPDVWRLRYPDGPVNAESLAVTPTGRAYIVTKSFLGESEVYRLPLKPDPARVQTVAKVGSIHFTPTRSGGIASMTATSAAINRAGNLFVVRTYTDALVWRLNGYLGVALAHRPTRMALPVEPQGEGVAIQGDHLIVDSEKVHSAVWQVQLPASVTGEATTSTAHGSASDRSVLAQVSGSEAGGIVVDGLPGWATRAGVVGVLVLAVAAFAFGLMPALRRRRRTAVDGLPDLQR